MFVTLHIRQLLGNHLEVMETSPEMNGTKTTVLEFDDSGDPEYICSGNYVWIHLNDENKWVLDFDGQAGSALLLDEQCLPLTCVATKDSIEYHYRDVGYNGTSLL